MEQDINNQGALKAALFDQISLELNESLIGTSHYQGDLKPKLKAVINHLEKKQKRHYNAIFFQDEQLVQSILQRIEYTVDFMVNNSIDDIYFASLAIEAKNKNQKAVEGIINKVLKE